MVTIPDLTSRLHFYSSRPRQTEKTSFPAAGAFFASNVCTKILGPRKIVGIFRSIVHFYIGRSRHDTARYDRQAKPAQGRGKCKGRGRAAATA